MTVRILQGDCRQVLASLPDESVHCAVTSPPYFGLRDYGVEGQIGFEASPDEYVDELVSVFRDVRRVLRDDGTLWLNLGDSYAAGPSGRVNPEKWPKQASSRGTTYNEIRGFAKTFGLANKQRLMIPARVALALQADGWWLRDEIIWHKPNPMPVSVTDRTTPAHEMLYMFSKSARYYYDMEAIKEPAAHPTMTHRSSRKTDAQENAFHGNAPTNLGRCGTNEDGKRHPRSVWSVPTKPFKGAHFATFPPALIEPCIKAGCPEGGTVLDPFGGAGTTGLVADRLKRNAILIELNGNYVAMAERRIHGDAPLLSRIALPCREATQFGWIK